MKRIILIFLLGASHGFAQHALDSLYWDGQDAKNRAALARRYENISSLRDMTSLIKEVSALKQFARLELLSDPDIQWQARLTRPVHDIDIKAGLGIKFHTDKIKNKYIGQADSQYSRRILLLELMSYFASVGYPQAKANFVPHEFNTYVDYEISMDLGSPCLIKKIVTPLKLPKDLFMDLNPGDVCDVSKIFESIENYERTLIAEGYQNSIFELQKADYAADFSSLSLVLGGFLGERVNFEFIDESRLLLASALDEDTLLYFKKNFSDPYKVKKQVIEYFKGRGFEYVAVKGPIKQIDEDGIVTFLYYVNPGDQYKIADFIIEGNRSIPTEELKDQIISSGFRDLFSFVDPKNYEQTKRDIVEFYRQKGFWDVSIQRSHIEYSQQKKIAVLTLNIDEGKKRVFGRIKMSGNLNLSDTKINELLKMKEGEALAQSQISQVEYLTRDFYFDNGYIDAKVMVDIDTRVDGELLVTDLNLKVEEGPLVKIGTIMIKGLIITDREVVKRELLFKQGDIYNQSFINQSRNALLSLGIFSSVGIENSRIINSNAISEVDISIDLKENDPGRIKFGPGFNLVRGLQYASEVSYNNIGGKGRRVYVRAAVSEEKQQKSIVGSTEERQGKTLLGRKVGTGYTEPYLFTLPVDGNISVYHQAIADDIWKISNTLELSVSHDFKGKYFQGLLTPFYRYQRLENEGTPSQADSLTTTGTSKVGSVGFRYKLDKRNSLSFPTAGFLLNTELSWARYAFLSEYRYFKWYVSQSFYKGIVSNFAFACELSLTSYESVHRRDASDEKVDVLPANQRLLAGGSNDVRGFENQLGPYVLLTNTDSLNRVTYQQESPLGGTKRLILKTELRKQVSPDLLAVSVFWDIGNAYFSADELRKFTERFQNTNTPAEVRTVEDNFSYSFEQIFSNPEYLFTKNYQSAGVSLGLLTPLGALNASLGWPVYEPQSENCKVNKICYLRGKDKPFWLQKYQFELNIGAEF